MSKEKEDRANLLDPNRQKIAKQNAVIPGGPENNNPTPVLQAQGTSVQSNSIYDDYRQMYPQMGDGMLNPLMVKPSGLQQNYPMGRGANAGAPFGMQQQPDTAGVSMAPDGMESGRLATEAQKRGLPGVGALGMQGMPATPAPGAIPSGFIGSGPPLMPGMQSAEQAAGKGINMRTGKRGK